MMWFVVFTVFAVFFKEINGSDRPNIILIVADDLGWNDVGFHGSNEIPTPNIDALGYNGVIFDRHYSQESCTPSRAALLTGQYPIRLGYQGFPMRPGENRIIPHDAKTLPKELQKLGYKTHLVGKWHLGAGHMDSTPTGYGYDSHYGYWNGFVGYFDHAIGQDTMNGTDWFENLRPLDETGYVTDLFTERSLDIISNHQTDQPLFLSINHLAAHTGKTLGPDETVLEVADVDEVNRKYRKISDTTRRMLADVVSRLDKSIGQVILRLYLRGMLQNSVVVFISDNGGPTYGMHSTRSSNYPLRGIKTTLFEGGVRVPAAVYSPNIKHSGRIFQNLFHITDWVPTLYSAAGGDPEVFSDVDGIDQWTNIIKNLNQDLRKEILLNIDEQLEQSAFIGFSGKYKLIKNAPGPYNNYTGSVGYSTRSYLREVLKSDTSFAISRTNPYYFINFLSTLFRPQPSVHFINCRHPDDPPSCTEGCLFDLHLDPCESQNIADQNPDIVEELQGKLDYFSTQLVPQQNTDVNPASNPDNCNGTWFNWLDGAEGCYFTRSQ